MDSVLIGDRRLDEIETLGQRLQLDSVGVLNLRIREWCDRRVGFDLFALNRHKIEALLARPPLDLLARLLHLVKRLAPDFHEQRDVEQFGGPLDEFAKQPVELLSLVFLFVCVRPIAALLPLDGGLHLGEALLEAGFHILRLSGVNLHREADIL